MRWSREPRSDVGHCRSSRVDSRQPAGPGSPARAASGQRPVASGQCGVAASIHGDSIVSSYPSSEPRMQQHRNKVCVCAIPQDKHSCAMDKRRNQKLSQIERTANQNRNMYLLS